MVASGVKRRERQEESVVRRTMVITLACASILFWCGVAQRVHAEDAAKQQTKAAERDKQDEKTEKGKEGNVRDGVKWAYDGFKKETAKGKKNLNELYEREKAKRNE